MNIPRKYQNLSLKHLEHLPTLHQGQADDCKIDNGQHRVWLSRCGVEDGEPYDHKVTIEALIEGRWETIGEYQAK